MKDRDKQRTVILSKEEKDQMSFVLGDLYQLVGERIYKLYEGENNGI